MVTTITDGLSPSCSRSRRARPPRCGRRAACAPPRSHMPAPRSRRRVAPGNSADGRARRPSHGGPRAGAAPRPGAARRRGRDRRRRRAADSALARASAGNLSGEVERWSSVGGGGDGARAAAAKAVRSRTGAPTGTSSEPRSAARGGSRRRRRRRRQQRRRRGRAGAGRRRRRAAGRRGRRGDEAGESGGEKQRSDIADDGERGTTSAWSSHTNEQLLDVRRRRPRRRGGGRGPAAGGGGRGGARRARFGEVAAIDRARAGAGARSCGRTSSSGASCTWMTGAAISRRARRRARRRRRLRRAHRRDHALPELSIDTNEAERRQPATAASPARPLVGLELGGVWLREWIEVERHSCRVNRVDGQQMEAQLTPIVGPRTAAHA